MVQAEGELLFTGHRVFVGYWKVPSVNRGEACATLGMYLKPLNYALTNGSSDKYYAMYIL